MKRRLNLAVLRCACSFGGAFVFVKLAALPLLQRVDLFPAAEFSARAYFKHGQNLVSIIAAVVPFYDAMVVFFISAWGISRLIRAIVARVPSDVRTAGAAGKNGRGPGSILIRSGAFLLAAGPPLVLFAWTIPTTLTAGSATQFKRTCSQCHWQHTAERPLHFVRPRQAWRLTVERMRVRAAGAMSPEQADAALRYLELVRSLPPRRLFEIKCSVCHDLSFRRRRRPEEGWRQLVDRLSRFNPVFLTGMECESIVDYVRAAGLVESAEPKPPDAQIRRTVETQCAQCHTLDIVLSPNVAAAEWPDVLNRMAAKMAEPIPAAEIPEIAQWVQQMRRNPPLYRSDVPHQNSALFFGKTPL